MIGTKEGDTRIRQTLERLELSHRFKGDTFLVDTTLPDGRDQVVYINSATSCVGDIEIRQVWSIACTSEGPLPELLANILLQDSSGRKLGAWEVTKVNDTYLAIFVAKIAGELDDEKLRAVIMSVGSIADHMENQLSEGRDEF